ncbi:YggT family protein [Bhargavaea beijingensis]|uniref:YggT family protein n=1 Tax=Bhargavaea beijingensis TaxID=426756 RepID=A0A1G7C6R7_9BACL|nr:YggT family protein [Bhargavaea beijingensis]MCW1926866.1 YggT family protein [Bhargavaea beijingensis]RSK36889.1 YggT family protein [Bhargavaea beijingensis]SDE35011.1 YggT family protein [Bhargavaea beijingensis]
MWALVNLLANAAQIYSILLVIYVLMSWVPSTRETSIGRFLAKICEPYLDIFRKIIPPIGMIDISPIVALIALNLIVRGLYTVFGMIA